MGSIGIRMMERMPEQSADPGPKPPEGDLPLTCSAGDIHLGYFSFKEKLVRLLWMIVQATLFRWSLRRADRWRSFLMRCFGATVGKGCMIRSTVRVEVPWNITIGDGATLGEFAILYSLGPIIVGDHTTISQYSHVCAGSHDYTRSDMPLHRVPVRIGADVWVCADVFVGPGVVIGDGTLVGARATVVSDLPPWKICVGNPARPVRDRPFRRVGKER
jgi:putative colanic acid biosynthesis acetyltransferase WcaF